MKFYTCKVCEIHNKQNVDSHTNDRIFNKSDNVQHFCQHSLLNFANDTQSLMSPYFRDMILTTHILRGNCCFFSFINTDIQLI